MQNSFQKHLLTLVALMVLGVLLSVSPAGLAQQTSNSAFEPWNDYLRLKGATQENYQHYLRQLGRQNSLDEWHRFLQHQRVSEEEYLHVSRLTLERARAYLESNNLITPPVPVVTEESALDMAGKYLKQSVGFDPDQTVLQQIRVFNPQPCDVYVPIEGYEGISQERIEQANMRKFYKHIAEIRTLVTEAQKIGLFAIQTCDAQVRDAVINDFDYAIRRLESTKREAQKIIDANAHQIKYYTQERWNAECPWNNPENALIRIGDYAFVLPDDADYEKFKDQVDMAKAGDFANKANLLASWTEELNRIVSFTDRSLVKVRENQDKLRRAFNEKACEACENLQDGAFRAP